MRLAAALTTWTALALFPGSPPTDLVIRYEVGQVIVYEEEDSSSFETNSFSATINGEELPEEALEQMQFSAGLEEEQERIRTTTRFTSVEDGRLVAASRTFDVVEKTETKNGEEFEHESPLPGLTLLLTEVGEDEVEAEVEDEDAEIDDVHLLHHRLAYTAAEYIPDGAVEIGDTWEMDRDRILRLMQIGGPTYYERDDSDAAVEEVIEENASATAEVTYDRDEERDGIECAVLVLAVEMELSAEDLPPQYFGEAEDAEGMSGNTTMEVEGTETVWFALEGGRPVASELEIEGEVTMEMIFEDPEMEMELIITVLASFESETTSTWTLESDD